jgi:hypothetical protein
MHLALAIYFRRYRHPGEKRQCRYETLRRLPQIRTEALADSSTLVASEKGGPVSPVTSHGRRVLAQMPYAVNTLLRFSQDEVDDDIEGKLCKRVEEFLPSSMISALASRLQGAEL